MISRADYFVRTMLVAAMFCAAGCHSGPYVWVHQRPSEPATSGDTVIGLGDLLEVMVFGDEKLSTRGRVLADGTFTLPLLGPIPAAGKTAAGLTSDLEAGLTRYVTVPKVTVIIQESQVSLAVIGEVKQAGMVQLVTPATVLQALAKAGGMTEFADSSGIYVLRSQGNATQRIRFKYSALVEAEPAATRFRLRTGDVVVVE